MLSSTHLCPPTPGNMRKPKSQKANITIGTLNVNSYAAPSSNMMGIEKWSAINRTINNNNIAILTLQETHLDPALLHDVTACFGRKLEILNSPHPVNPRAMAGVAFIINKALINPREYKLHVLKPGWAAALKIKWLEDEEILLLNVYAPNFQEESVSFWEA